ncbi:amino acid adenylation domain-containing protein [uncultured Nostoc sp.]|uniref:amino acid adenylation domain-containing protein n=1 Tax=uncultured Nostoc sp. TaxID=340711 RepID=UPI0035CAA93B
MTVKNKNIENFYPLSPMQQGILYHSLAAPKSGNYFEQYSWTLYGKLNITAFHSAWQHIVERHSILRTCFVWEGLKEPVQVVHRQVTLPWQEYNWQHLSPDEQQQKLEVFLESDRSSGFELTQPPLMRFTLVQLSDTYYNFTWSHHHLLVDGWSVALIFKEVLACYKAFSKGEDVYLEPIRSYRDYIVWLQQQNLSVAETFWRETLKDFTTPTWLWADRGARKSLTPEDDYTEQKIQLSAVTTAALQSVAQQHQLTLNTLLQGAWALLLSCYSGQEDVVFGAVASGRPPTLAKAESMVGLFINTLPVRVKVSPKEFLLPWLQKIQTQLVEARQYEYSPLVKVQGWSEVPKGFALFDNILVFENYPVDPSVQEPDIDFEIESFYSFARTNYPVTLTVNPGEELLFKITYDDSDRFDIITRMLRHLQTLLEGMVTNPQQRLCELSLLTEIERHQLLLEWNNTEVDYPQQQCIHKLFEAQVERTPDAVAVVFEDEQLTYWELNARANQLAYYLRSLGVKPEVLVGICVERSLSMVIGLLAIFKSGGAYVPLDSTYPPERLAFILQDAAVSVLLTQQHLIENLPQHETRVVCLDTDWESVAQQTSHNLINDCTTDNLAYIIYTSGSTGQPKGVLVNHSNVVRLLAATESWYNFNQQDVFSLFHSIAFDFSVWEIWGALLYGGKLVVVPYWLSRSPEEFYQLLLTQQVTVLNQTPSAFRQLIQVEESLDNINNLSLRKVIFGGEALQIESLGRWFERHGDQSPQLINMYGITETTVHVTYRPLKMADLEVASASLIGRPIGDLQVYLLDRYGQPVPIGIPGEMYIGGAGVVRGYLNRPELTPVRFIPNPFSDKANARLYKSGDLARYLPNGDIEYLGRIDHQVKVRGFRIELGEIEAVISQYPAVRETVVIVSDDSENSKRIVTYVVPQKEQTLAVPELRGFLESKLPSYMVPAAFVILEALPLTSNGKIDRRALPAPDNARPELEEVFVAPRTKEEKTLAQIWAEVLGLEQVGIHDNFFSLGGDSIRSIRVQSLAKEKGLSFSIQQVFQYQTIYQLLEAIKTVESEIIKTEETQPFSLISQEDKQRLPGDIEDAYPLSILQMGMVFHSKYSPEGTTYHDVFSYHLQALLDIQVLQTAIELLVNRHAVLRTSFQLTDFSEPLQLVHQNIDILLQVEDWHHLSTSELEDALNAWLDDEKRRQFDWSIPPLLRFFVHRCTEETFYLTVSFHHAILDGWSVASMLTELFGHYFSLLGEKTDFLEPPLLSLFRDFIALERQMIVSEESQHYWMEKLHDRTITMLPRWHFSPLEAKVGQVGVQEVPISAETSQGLQQLAKSTGIPFKSVLLAAHLRVLSLLCGQSDVLTGMVTNGRPEHKDGERVLGLFLNTVPFRLKLSGGTWVNLVKEVFEVERELLLHRRYPLAAIQRSLGGQPLFETIFNFTHFHIYQAALVDKNLQSLGGKFYEETNFPLMVNFSQDPTSFLVKLSLNYKVSEFSLEQIKSISGYYARTLQAIASTPQEHYELQELLCVQERHQLLIEWNNTQTNYPIDQYIHQLFEAQVERTPDAVAVVFEDEQLTYCELNTRANQLAHYLHSLGVKPEVLVGICVERSLNMVIGLLAILKAGGAYVPLDPSYPKERLAYMLEDSRPGVLLTQQNLVENLPTDQAQVICIDSDWQLIADENTENPGYNITVESLAYVIYTSGSTGRPKGAMNTHQGICNRLLWMQDTYQLTAADSVLQKTPFSFDVSVWEFFWTLMTGARLVVAQPEGHRDPNYIVNLILKQQITTLHFVPSMLQVFLEAEGLEKCQSLVRVIASGEALQVQLQQSFFNRLDTQLYNLYGPTEAAVDVTFWQCQDSFTNQKTVPIGRPIANIQIYLLDKYLNPVAFGVAGEVYIGGVGVGRGYLNRPDLTAEKFIPNPFSNEAAARLYKTGDLAHYLANGDIEYLGRIDNQVKIRGFRIELEEIEAVISQYPAVRETVVTVHCSEADSQQIVAYVVPQKEETLAISELRGFLESKLPNYMVPATFVILEALPLTPNGKVDRKALPTPNGEITREHEYVAPRTAIEQTLTNIWQELLFKEKVSIHDNFFEIGGDSILSIQVVSRAKNSGIQITTRQIFQNQTIAELARVANTTISVSAQQVIVTGVAPLTPIQHWFFAQNRQESHHFNQSVLLHLPKDIKPELLEKAVEKLLEHHDALRLRFRSQASEYKQINYDKENNVPFSVVDLSSTPRLSQPQALSKIATEFQASLNLSTGPIMQVVMFYLASERDARLLIIIHHLAVDGVSWRILLSDLETIYQQLIVQQPIQLNAKTTAFIDWAEKLNNYAQSEIIKQELDYWLNQPWSKITPLPLDYAHAQQENTVDSAASVSVKLSVEETQTFLGTVNEAYNTQINDMLLSALILSLAQWAGNSTVVIDLEGHGREELFEDVDLSRTVGWFTTLFPVLLQLPDLNQPSSVIKSIKEQLRAIPSRGIGYGILRYLCKDISVNQQLQTIATPKISFNYLGQFDQVKSQNGWKFASESTGANQSSKQTRDHLLDINALVIEGELQINWTYSSNVHTQATVENLAQNYIQTIRSIIKHCQSQDAFGYTPSDFPDAQLNQLELEELLEILHE